jgi:hypothetical protein
MLSAETDDAGKQVVMTLNKPLSGFPTSGALFTLMSGDKSYIPDSVTEESVNPPSLRLWFGTIFSDTDQLRLSYGGNQIISAGGDILPPFQEVPVVNTILHRLPLPGTLRAENYSVNSGFSFEACSDLGGGQNAGWTDPGDYLEFLVKIGAKAVYRITYRYSCNSANAQAQLSLTDNGIEPLHTVTFTTTGGWQSWNSVSVTDSLPAGLKTIRITALTSGFNLNWIEFSKISGSTDSTVIDKAGFRIFPNPASDFVNVEIRNPGGTSQKLELVDMLGRIVYRLDTPSTKTATCILDTSSYLPGIYLIRLGQDPNTRTQTLFIKNMKP